MKRRIILFAFAAAQIYALDVAHAASTLQRSVSNHTIVIENVPAVEATPDYSTGDVMGGKQELANAVEEARGAGRIVGVTVANAGITTGINMDVLVFKADPAATTFTENSAVDIADADLAKLVGVVQLTVHVAFAGGVISLPAAKPEMEFIVPSGTSLYCVVVARGTINMAATNDLKLKVDIERR